MKKFVAAVAVCLFAGISSWMLSVWADNCQQPSSSTKACADPQNEVASCTSTAWDQTTCTGFSRYLTPVQVPDGTVGSASGTTSTERTDCTKVFSCIWYVYTPTIGACGGEPDWDSIPYSKAQKIVVGTEQCPVE